MSDEHTRRGQPPMFIAPDVPREQWCETRARYEAGTTLREIAIERGCDPRTIKACMALRVRRDHVMYDKWERQGFLMTTEGNVVHYGFIEQFIVQLGERYNIREIAYDRWNATMMVQTLQDDGFTILRGSSR